MKTTLLILTITTMLFVGTFFSFEHKANLRVPASVEESVDLSHVC